MKAPEGIEFGVDHDSNVPDVTAVARASTNSWVIQFGERAAGLAADLTITGERTTAFSAGFHPITFALEPFQ